MTSVPWHSGVCAFFELSGGLKLEGVLVVEEGPEWVVATPTHETLLGKAVQAATATKAPVHVQYLKIRTRCLRAKLPPDWEDSLVSFRSQLPTLRSVMLGYTDQASATEAEEATAPRPARHAGASGSGLTEQKMARLSALYEDLEGDEGAEAAGDDEDEELLDEASFYARHPAKGARSLPAASRPYQVVLKRRGGPGQNVLRGTVARPQSEEERMDRIERLMMEGKDVEKLLQLEVIRAMRDMRGPRDAAKDPLETLNFADREKRAQTSLGRAVSRMDMFKTRVHDCPGKISDEYRQEIMRELGADDSTPWKYLDFARRIQWGMMKSMQKTFVMNMEFLELLDHGHVRQAHAQVVQNSKAIHQMVNDNDWKVAWQMTGLVDPLSRKKFAGTAFEREVCADFVRAEDELDRRARTSLKGSISDEEDAPTAPPRSKAERAKAAREKAAKEKAEKAASEKAAKEKGGKP